MEPKHHPIEKEHHVPNLLFWMQTVNFPGCNKPVIFDATYPAGQRSSDGYAMGIPSQRFLAQQLVDLVMLLKAKVSSFLNPQIIWL